MIAAAPAAARLAARARNGRLSATEPRLQANAAVLSATRPAAQPMLRPWHCSQHQCQGSNRHDGLMLYLPELHRLETIDVRLDGISLDVNGVLTRMDDF